ncbi:MAG: polysaccharide deacetylase family protein, partial [Desulfofundulus sp.]
MRKYRLILLLLSIFFLLIPLSKERRDAYNCTGRAVVSEVATGEKLIALTFDDGPDPLYTPRILEILEKYNARATFFVLGPHVRQYPHLVRR